VRSDGSGFVLTELLLAAAVLGLGLVVFYQTLGGARRLSARGHDRLVAQGALQDAVSRAEARMPDEEPAAPPDLLSPEWSVQPRDVAGYAVWNIRLSWSTGRHTDELEMDALPTP
jgi:type II secretory pathway component PulJ